MGSVGHRLLRLCIDCVTVCNEAAIFWQQKTRESRALGFLRWAALLLLFIF